MNASDVYTKLKAANEALEEYLKGEKNITWHNDIIKEKDSLIRKAHVLNAAGTTCPRCGGTGKV